jgi:hypothetical protein
MIMTKLSLNITLRGTEEGIKELLEYVRDATGIYKIRSFTSEKELILIKKKVSRHSIYGIAGRVYLPKELIEEKVVIIAPKIEKKTENTENFNML